MRFVLAVGLTLAASEMRGQGSGVSGTVYDSVGRAPLQGAIVQMVPPAGTPLFSAATDARGRYTISGAPPGRYFIEFSHHVLDSLALEPPLRAVELRAGETTKLDMAVPSPASIVTQTCTTAPSDSLGLFFGVLRDSRNKMGLDSGQVTVRWHELVIDAAGLTNHERVMSSRTNAEGWFAMCRVPSGTEVVVLGRHGSDSTGMNIVAIPNHGLRRFDLDVGGVAAVKGRITSRGRPVNNARVRAGSDERATYTDSSGAYRLGAVAAGTQTIDIRALGYAPESKPVTLSPESEAVVDVEMTTVKRVMDTIKVVAQRVYSIDAMGFERRRRSSVGRFFDENDVRRRAPFGISQLLYEIPSLRVDRRGFETTYLMRGGNDIGGAPCQPAFFIDGVMMPSDLLSELDLFVRPEQLEGMEVYRGIMVPPEFHTNGGCGAIVVWTKRPRTRGK